LFLNKQGQLWVNSSNGLNYAKIKNTRFFQIGGNFAYSPQLKSSFVNHLIMGTDKSIWGGSPDAGLSLIKTNAESSEEFSSGVSGSIDWSSEHAIPIFITGLGLDNKKKLWVGSANQLQWIDAISLQEIPLDGAWSQAKMSGIWATKITGDEKLVIDNNNQLFYQQNSAPLFHYQFPKNISDSAWSVISNPIDHVYWIGSNHSSQIFRFDANKSRISELQLFGQNGNPIKGVMSFLQTADEILLVGTQGQGVMRKNLKTGEDTWLTTQEGLPDNTIYSLLEDNKGHIWITSNKGLSRFTISTQAIQNFTVADGIQSNEFNQRSAFRSEDGLLFFGGINGITVIDENTFTPNQHIPKTYIHSASLFTSNGLKRLELSRRSLGELDYQSNSLSLKIGAIDLLNPDGIRYFYRLVGQSDQWQDLGNNRTINLLKLPAGDYIFEITSCNNENTCNPIAKTVSFSIAPAPWLSSWAFGLYFLLFLSLIVFFIKKHQEKLLLQKNLADNEKKISQELRSLNTLKDQFLANTSHELRTPLNGIIGLSEMLQMDPKNISQEDSQKSLSAIQQCGVQLSGLVNDLLDFSQFHSKRIRLNRTVFSLFPLVDQVAHLLQPMLIDRPVDIEIDISDPDMMVYADENRIRQVLYNLLNNAIKFSDTGIIKVSAVVIDQDIKISVVDQGLGIEAKKQNEIFISFAQVDGSSTRNQGGVGLGLSICKEIIELHGVELKLQSKIEQGSTFSFLLPDRTKYLGLA